MNKQKIKDKKRARRTIIYLYMLFILFSLFVGVSYTWFTLSRSPRVSNMNVYINSNPGMELSKDMEEWGLQIDFWDIVNYTDPLDEEKEKPILRPVTWSEENQCFVAAAYGVDGRLKPFRDWHSLTDERNANKQNIENYYIKATFYARSGQPADISLSPAMEVNEGVAGAGTYVRGVPVWNPGHYVIVKDENGYDKKVLVGYGHDNGGQGAEKAIRFGFKTTVLVPNEEGEFVPDPEREPEFVIFEPNSDTHVYAEDGYISTASMDGTEDLIDPEKIILQSTSFWDEAAPIEHGVVIHTLGDFIDREGEPADPPKIFSVKTNEIIKIELYVWLEGQDIDCTNQSSDAKIEANIQFYGESEEQTGLVKIE
ncbi:MAG: hypothetical protein IJA05_06775 [Oscillospiraceae bacterium]|nr:hypothetical protein [Oscillospiraceae bacterium]